MSDHFVKGFDVHQHGLLRALYGDLVPPLQMILVRPGLYGVVDRMFAELGRLRDRNSVRVVRVESRNAGWLNILTTGAALGADDVIAAAEEDARRGCEHCGRAAQLILKVGLESLLTLSPVELGDRLLCVDCADTFREKTGL